VRAIAPGKLVLTGAYAVLEGAPAVVAAIDRYAIADVFISASGDWQTPEADVRALYDEAGERKLGLGSSAAAVVASLGARALALGEDLSSAAVRSPIFHAAREAHASVQGGGSGVDVAASVHGGVLRYAIDANGNAAMRSIDLPGRVHMIAYDSGSSARTSALRARFDAFRSRAGARRFLTALGDLATEAAASAEAGDAVSFIAFSSDFGRALAELGRACDSPIVLPAFADLASLAEHESAAFLPSGAGGGDVCVWLGLAPPSATFASRAAALSIRPLALRIDRGGLRAQSPS
jgi:phosphomevalonate kinase